MPAINGDMQMLKGAHSRCSIMDAAHALFINQGYAATSMRQIAKCAGLALGSIYNYFSSKEAVFQALIMERHPFQAYRQLLNTGDFDQKTARILLDQLGQRSESLNLLLIEFVEFQGKHLPELCEAGITSQNIPPLKPWRAFLGMFVSYQITRLLLASTMPTSAQQISPDAFIDIFLHGILKPE